MSRQIADRPDYRERGIGYERYATDLPGPYTQTGASMAGYVFRADGYSLQGVVNHYLKGDERHRYIALPMVVLTMVDMPRVYLSNNPGLGEMHEIDGGFQIACISVDRQTHEIGIALFMPYLWVNTGAAMATGREVLGFRKDVAISFSEDDTKVQGGASLTHIRAWVTPSFGAKLQPGWVARILPGTGRTWGDGASGSWPEFSKALLSTVEHALPRLAALLNRFLPQQVFIGGDLLLELLRKLGPGGLTVAFLKQFRDSQSADRACYQATLQAPAMVRHPDLKHLGRGTRVEIGNFASHPIASELGLIGFAQSGGTYEAALTFQVQFDLDVGMQKSSAPACRKKVAILGGGPAALAAMMDLSKYPERFELTLYQVGWRLGGKCASSRGFSSPLPGAGAPPHGEWGRNEEHGLHMALGFYENFFDLLRQAYDNLHRSEEWALRTWSDAVAPRICFTLEEHPWPRSRWVDLAMGLPENSLVPGERARHAEASGGRPYLLDGLVTFAEALLRMAERIPPRPFQALGHELDLQGVRGVLRDLLEAGAAWVERAGVHVGRLGRALQIELRSLHEQLHTPGEAATGTRDWPFLSELAAVELGVRFMCGIGALLGKERGFASLDDLEFTDWLDATLLFPMLPWTRASSFLRTCYLLPFAYEQGDPNRPRLAAGAGARALLRIVADYAGSVAYDFRAGMAECVIVPFYQTIQRRCPDARFEFFCRVRDLRVESGRITEIHLGRQATVRGGAAYQPLVVQGRIECFPAHPLYEQLEQGERLKQGRELLPGGYDLESNWTEWSDVETEVLKLGEDFDAVVLAIPPPASQCFTRELERESPAWANLLRHVTGVPTLAAQFWMTKTLPELGWGQERSGAAGPPLILGYEPPLAALAEMGDILRQEAWPGASPPPRSVLYLCGPMLAPPNAPGCSEPSASYIVGSREAAEQQSLAWTEQSLAYLFPKAFDPDGEIRWQDFASPLPVAGSLRLRAQYFRANTSLSELYITSFPGTLQHRLPAQPGDFENLFLAGDWVKNNLDIGSLEGAILSGRMAARALLGMSYSLYGERDPMPWSG